MKSNRIKERELLREKRIKKVKRVRRCLRFLTLLVLCSIVFFNNGDGVQAGGGHLPEADRYGDSARGGSAGLQGEG